MDVYMVVNTFISKKRILDKLVGKGLNGLNNGYTVNNKRTLTIPLMFFL